jgi:hypothetical protein
MKREYYGLPVTVATDEPTVVARHAQDSSQGDSHIGRLGLTCMFIDSDPYWAAVVYQYGFPVASIDCIGSQAELLRGLAEDTPEKLRNVFGITEESGQNVRERLPGLGELRKAQWLEAGYQRALWNMEHKAVWDTRSVGTPVRPDPPIETLLIRYPAAATYLAAERLASASRTQEVGLRAMSRLKNGEDHHQVLADMTRDSMRASIRESAYYPGRYLIYGPTDLVSKGPIESSHRLSPSIEVTIHPAVPFHLAVFSRNGKVVLVEHCIDDYESWLQRISNDSAFVAHIEQI